MTTTEQDRAVEIDDLEDDTDRLETYADRAGVWASFVFRLVIVGGLLLVVVSVVADLAPNVVRDVVPAEAMEPGDGDVLGSILASETIIAALRIGVLFLVGYIVVSVVAALTRGHFLIGVGPLRTGTLVPVKRLQEGYDTIRAELDEAEETIDTLLDALAERNEVLDNVTSYIDTLIEERNDRT